MFRICNKMKSDPHITSITNAPYYVWKCFIFAHTKQSKMRQDKILRHIPSSNMSRQVSPRLKKYWLAASINANGYRWWWQCNTLTTNTNLQPYEQYFTCEPNLGLLRGHNLCHAIWYNTSWISDKFWFVFFIFPSRMVCYKVEMMYFAFMSCAYRPFMYYFPAFGCADPLPPDNGFVERRDDLATIGCLGSDGVTWEITCRNGEWVGDFGDCTTGSV